MIFGVISFSDTVSSFSAAEDIGRAMQHEGLSLHRIDADGFSGGFLMNARLPWKEADFFYKDGETGMTVLFSGAVYNSDELIKLCDEERLLPYPELIARLFLREGPRFVSRLNGDFTIFLFHSSSGRSYLFRDHVGIRPLAWMADRQALIFSTDVNALCRAVSGGRAIDTDYLTGRFRYIDYRKTPDARVRKLLPGHFLRFSGAGLELKCYWDPRRIKVDRHMNYETTVSDLKALVGDAVRIRHDRRFTAGAHVSSGLDSALVSVLAREQCSEQEVFYGFSWSPAGFMPAEIEYDERELVRIHCATAGITPVFSDMTTASFLRQVSRYYKNQGYFHEAAVMEQAAARNTNLLFSGWGGDEFISTADRCIETDLLTGLRLRTYLRRNPLRPARRFLKYFLQYTLYPALGILQKGISRSFDDDARYLRKRYRKSDRKAIRNFYFHTSRRGMHLGLFSFYHLQERCESWTSEGYRMGIEYRYPLLDRRIIDYILRVPSSLLCRTDHFRPLMRVISEGVVAEEVWSNKSKRDPVFLAYRDELLKDAAGILSEEAEIWKGNSEMQFADFERLEKDLRLYRENPVDADMKVLFRGLIFLKAAYEFTKSYR
ncbi:MAG: hypothetical protein E4G92_00605 [Bacteroidia bacterium]|nr:MAG: hypothetical protein E4G92_00605 [Bacteroidia bacterium]